MLRLILCIQILRLALSIQISSIETYNDDDDYDDDDDIIVGRYPSWCALKQ